MDTFPPCPPGEITACCLTQIPNTSEWITVCPRDGKPPEPAVIPTVSQAGLAVMLVAVAVVGLWRARP